MSFTIEINKGGFGTHGVFDPESEKKELIAEGQRRDGKMLDELGIEYQEGDLIKIKAPRQTDEPGVKSVFSVAYVEVYNVNQDREVYEAEFIDTEEWHQKLQQKKNQQLVEEARNGEGVYTPPAPLDDEWGFTGSARGNIHALWDQYSRADQPEEPPQKFIEEKTEELWGAVFAVTQKFFEEPEAQVVDNFLRSRWGRHLCDAVVDGSLDRLSSQAVAEKTAEVLPTFTKAYREIWDATLTETFDDERTLQKQTS